MKTAITYTVLLLSASIGLFYSCKKDETIDKKLYIRGRLFVNENAIINPQNLPLGNKRVLLADKNDTNYNNFLYSDSTDKDGYFVFTLYPSSTKSFSVRFADSIGVYYYTGEVPDVVPGSNDVTLVATLDASGLGSVQLRCIVDGTTGGVPGAAIRFYSSAPLARTNDTTTASLKGIADSYGNFLTYQLQSGEYFINSQKTINGILYTKIAEPVTINKGMRAIVTLALLPPDTSQLAGLKIFCKDSLGGFFSKTSVSIFSGKVQANLDDSADATFNGTTDQYGQLTTYSLMPGTYYINAKQVIDTMIFSSKLNSVILTRGNVALPAPIILLRTK